MSRWAVRWPRVPASRRATRMRRCGQARSAANYPHLVAQRLGLDLVDVTYSGATTAHVLTDRQNDAAAADRRARRLGGACHRHDRRQRRRLRPAADGGGPAPAVRSLPVLGGRLRELLDPAARDRALVDVGESLKAVGRTVRQRAPRARVLFVDYLTVLPPPGEDAPPLSGVDAALGRRVAATLERLTSEAAADTGCEVVRAADASREHHAWSADPWTTKPTRFGLPIARPSLPGASERGGHARRGRPDHRPSRKSAQRSPIMIEGAFVLARVIRGRAEASATRRFSTPRTRSFSSSALSGSLPIATLQDEWYVVIAVSLMHVSTSVPEPGRSSRSRRMPAVGSDDLARAFDRPRQGVDVLALGEQVQADGRRCRGSDERIMTLPRLSGSPV